jgi:hypothetical protein
MARRKRLSLDAEPLDAESTNRRPSQRPEDNRLSKRQRASSRPPRTSPNQTEHNNHRVRTRKDKKHRRNLRHLVYRMDSNIFYDLDNLFTLRSEEIKMLKFSQHTDEREVTGYIHQPTTQPNRAKRSIKLDLC